MSDQAPPIARLQLFYSILSVVLEVEKYYGTTPPQKIPERVKEIAAISMECAKRVADKMRSGY